MMSIATAKQFLQKVQNDQALQAKLQALSNGKREEKLAEVVRIAAADGFVFTPGEYESAVKEHLQHTAGPLGAEQLAQVLARPITGELSEEDLGLVAGGTGKSKTRAAAKKLDNLLRDGEITIEEFDDINQM